MNRRVIFRISVLVLGSLAAIYTGVKTGHFGLNEPVSIIGGDFTLVDQNNAVVTQDALLGHYSLVTFGYTFCPDICPMVQRKISTALDSLGHQADDVTPYLITVDPRRDTVKVMAEYSKHFHPRLVALTGTRQQIARAASAFQIFYERTKNPHGAKNYYLMDHSSEIYVMNHAGKYVTHFTHATPVDEMIQRLRDIL